MSVVRELFPGVRVVRTAAPLGQAFAETPELSLVIETDSGPIVVVGCSHPGIERILAAVAATTAPGVTPPPRDGTLSQPGAEPAVRLLVGGLHLVNAPDPEIARLVSALQERWRIAAIAPGHCTGEVAFATLRRRFGASYRFAGVGTVLEVQQGTRAANPGGA